MAARSSAGLRGLDLQHELLAVLGSRDSRTHTTPRMNTIEKVATQ
jgi:hypothetical protein